jgi:hypothetical protein
MVLFLFFDFQLNEAINVRLLNRFLLWLKSYCKSNKINAKDNSIFKGIQLNALLKLFLCLK